MNSYLYILKCSDGSFYTGSTKDLARRLNQHNSGLGANYTSKRLPVEMVYIEKFERIDWAFKREKQIQGWSRKKKLALISGLPQDLHHLAVCLNETSHKNYKNGPSAPLRDLDGE